MRHTCAICGTPTYEYFNKIGKAVCTACSSNRYSSTGNDGTVGTPNILPMFSFEFEIGNKEYTTSGERDFYCEREHGYYDDETGDYVECDCDCDFYDDNTEEDDDADDVKDFYSPALLLIAHGFIPCDDCTVHKEYKSPIYSSVKPLHNISSLLADCQELVGDEAGTHIHVTTRHKSTIKRYYQEIFAPLYDALSGGTSAMVATFGRPFNDYARNSTTIDSRYRAINIFTNYDTVEFRLCKFRTPKQFFNLVNLVRKIVWVIDRELDCPRDSWDLEALAQLIVDLYEKHAAIIRGYDARKVVLNLKQPLHPSTCRIAKRYCTTLQFYDGMYANHASDWLVEEGCEVFLTVNSNTLEVRSCETFRHVEFVLNEHYIRYNVLERDAILRWHWQY